MMLNPYAELVSEDDFWKGFANLNASLTESQPGNTIQFLYDLGVLWASLFPS